MTIEDKAKAYDGALERAEGLIDFCSDSELKTLEYVFPELRESEDERIRKELIELIGCMHDADPRKERWLAWLEKQKEENFIDKNLVKEEAHRIAWEYSKHYDPLLSKESWCEMAALDMAYWLEKQGEQKLLIEKLPEEMKTIGKSLGFTTQEEADKYNQMVSDLIMSDGNKGEQKPSDYENANIQQKDFAPKDEPKFHEGEWIVNNDNGNVYQVTKIRDDEYCLWPLDAEIQGYFRIIDVDNEYHLWSINDAKDGDVLTNGKIIVIFKHFEEPSYRQHIVAYIGLDRGGDIQITDDTWRLGVDKAKPATKEQRDTLMKAMADAGYTFDFEKKELKLLITNGGDFELEACPQAPAWSEEDDRLLRVCVAAINGIDNFCTENKQELTDWLKSLRPQNRWKPSEEQIKILDEILNYAANHESPYWHDYIFETLNNLIRQLKKLKEK